MPATKIHSYLRLPLISVLSAVMFVGLFFGIKLLAPGIGSLLAISSQTRPTDIQYRRDALGNIMVSWKTNRPTVGMLIYGFDDKRLFMPVMSANDTEAQKFHMAVISAGPMNTVYFKIFSGGKLYGEGDKPLRAEIATGDPALSPSPVLVP